MKTANQLFVLLFVLLIAGCAHVPTAKEKADSTNVLFRVIDTLNGIGPHNYGETTVFRNGRYTWSIQDPIASPEKRTFSGQLPKGVISGLMSCTNYFALRNGVWVYEAAGINFKKVWDLTLDDKSPQPPGVWYMHKYLQEQNLLLADYDNGGGIAYGGFFLRLYKTGRYYSHMYQDTPWPDAPKFHGTYLKDTNTLVLIDDQTGKNETFYTVIRNADEYLLDEKTYREYIRTKSKEKLHATLRKIHAYSP